MNLQILLFKQQINNLISKSNLPIGVVQLIFKDILNDLDLVYNHQVEKEYQLTKEKEQQQKQQQKQIDFPFKDQALVSWQETK